MLMSGPLKILKQNKFLPRPFHTVVPLFSIYRQKRTDDGRDE